MKAVIFDIDGTLTQTNAVADGAWVAGQRVLAELRGHDAAVGFLLDGARDAGWRLGSTLFTHR